MYGVFRYVLWVDNTVSMNSITFHDHHHGLGLVLSSLVYNLQICLYYNLYLHSYITNRLINGNGVILFLFICPFVLHSDSGLSLPTVEVPNPF
jgi:hypothetical protein